MSDLSTFSKGGYITEKDCAPGSVPVISGGIEPAFFHDTPNRERESIVIARSGVNAGHISYWNTPIYVSDTFTIDPDVEVVSYKYLYYCLKSIQNNISNSKRGAGVPHINKEALGKFLIPVVNHCYQKTIVETIDKFDLLCNDLCNGLPAEIAARKKQYEFYLDKLLSFQEVFE